MVIEIIPGFNKKFLNEAQKHFMEHALLRAQCVITEKVTKVKGEAAFSKPYFPQSPRLSPTTESLVLACLTDPFMEIAISPQGPGDAEGKDTHCWFSQNIARDGHVLEPKVSGLKRIFDWII